MSQTVRILFSMIFFTSTSFAADIPAMEYPELQVSPRASERLAMESKIEQSSKMTRFIPLQVSGLATMIAGLSYAPQRSFSKDPNNYYGWAATGIGLAWTTTWVLMSINYLPYTNGSEKVSQLPKGTKREQLFQERMAEEVIDGAADTMKKLTWLSVISNIGVGILLNSGTDNLMPNLAFTGVSALAALSPLVFKSGYWMISNQQREYKKRIYTSLSMGPTLLREPGYSGGITPGLELALNL